MADVDLQVRLNKRIRLSYTVGEDRTLEVLVSDGTTLMPLDLTGAKLTLTLPRASGYAIKRRTGPLAFKWSLVVNLGGVAVFQVPSHGLATGDSVYLEPVDVTQPLPAPFSADANYVAIVPSSDTFSLVSLDTDGNSTSLALAGTPLALSSANLLSQDFQITSPTLGLAACRLTAACTSSCAVGQGQSYQLVYTDSAGLTRIFAGSAMLDVLNQADYLELDGAGGG